jgi:hypothetical protein
MADVGLSLDPLCSPRIVFFVPAVVELFATNVSPSAVP